MDKVANEAQEVKGEMAQAAGQIARREADFTLQPQNLAEALKFADLIAASELCPKEYRGKPPSVLIAVMMGAELGISPMQSLQNITVINGRPTMWGDLVLGLIQASGTLESINERDAQEAFAKKEGRCEVKRRGSQDSVVRTFSLDMAEKAGLLARGGPDAPWSRYPGRMLQMRARSWALRDTFADVLKGLILREEIEDYPALPEPIQMPRRASEVSQAEIERFTAGSGVVASSAQAVSGAPDGNIWTGIVASVTERSGQKDGKPWTLYTVKGADGQEFKTFSKNDAEFARGAGKLPVEIRHQPGKQGGNLIVSIGPGKAADREAGDQDEP